MGTTIGSSMVVKHDFVIRFNYIQPVITKKTQGLNPLFNNNRNQNH